MGVELLAVAGRHSSSQGQMSLMVDGSYCILGRVSAPVFTLCCELLSVDITQRRCGTCMCTVSETPIKLLHAQKCLDVWQQ